MKNSDKTAEKESWNGGWKIRFGFLVSIKIAARDSGIKKSFPLPNKI